MGNKTFFVEMHVLLNQFIPIQIHFVVACLELDADLCYTVMNIVHEQ